MIEFLCIFFPPVISVALTTRIRKENFNNYQYFAYYAVFSIIINGIMFWILVFMFDSHSISSPNVFTTSFSAKYISLSSILAFVLAYVTEGLRKFKALSKDFVQEDETQKKIDKDE